MSENVNVTTPQGEDLSKLKQMFSNFDERKKAQAGARKTSEERLAKYFVPRKTTEHFRILPPKPGKNYIEEAFFHVVPVNVAGGKKKWGIVYCPAHNDPKVQKLDSDGKPSFDQNGKPVMIPAPCPLCAKYKKEIVKQDPSIRGVKKENMTDAQLVIKAKNDAIYKEAIQWEAKKFYIVRGIDTGADKDGVKFWRFKHNYRNQGTLDKLLPILKEYADVHKADFSSPKNGTELNIIVSDSPMPNGRTYKAVTAITYKGPSPLHSDPLIAREWLDDIVSWRDVFKPKKAPGVEPIEFLEMILSGTNPYWENSDPNSKHWVFPGRPDLELAANTRKRNLDADSEEDFEMASDVDEYDTPVSISNVTEKTVGTYKETAVDVGAELTGNATNQPVVETTAPEEPESSGDYDDLPF